MKRLERNGRLPDEMQGRWVIADEPTSELFIEGAEITCFGERVVFDYMEIGLREGALTVSLKVEDPAMEDSFQRANITELAITPEGKFFGYNVKFASQFVRSDD